MHPHTTSSPTSSPVVRDKRSSAKSRGKSLLQRAKVSVPLSHSAESEEVALDPNVALVDRLSREVSKLEKVERPKSQTRISTGSDVLDACLPQGGYVPGSVIEYLRATPASGASYLCFAAAAEAMKVSQGYLVLVDAPQAAQRIYPPVLQTQGIDLERCIFVRPESLADAIWATDQALRTPAVAAVIAELESFDDRTARRLQLAAEAGSTLALLLRSAAARHKPSWADVQWYVQSRVCSPTQTALASRNSARDLMVKLTRCRNGRSNSVVHLTIDATSGAIRSAAALRNAHATTASRQTVSQHLATQLAHPTSPSRKSAVG